MELDRTKEGLIQLYDSTLKKRLNKGNYATEIQGIKDKNQELFRNLKEAIIVEEGHENENIKEIANIIPEYVSNSLMQYSSKRKREVHQIDNNMNMVCFYVPLINSISSDLANRTVELWNEKMPNSKIGVASIEDINGGFKKGFCYITTAVCDTLNKGDDCSELTLLREYRDKYLIHTIDGEQVVNTYYNIAPTIVNRINKSEESYEVYKQIWKSYNQPCLTLIEDGKNEECKELYSRMVASLERKYM
jgi:hypothetical protein